MTTAAVAVDLTLVALAVVGLWVGATAFVEGAVRAARRVGVGELVVGLTVVAFGTSAPEFAVTLDAALVGKPDVAVANVVGSNVVNLGFVLGGVAAVRGLPSTPGLVSRDGTTLVGATALLLVALSDGRITGLEGGLLSVGLVAYLLYLTRGEASEFVPAADGDAFGWLDVPRLVGGLAVVVLAGDLLVSGASDLARVAGLSEWVVGATVVGLGTSAPEFATSIVAFRQGRTGVSAGNVLGSCVFNALGVVGVAAVVHPLPVSGAAVPATAGLLVLSTVVVATFYTRSLVSRREGVVLVVLGGLAWSVSVLPGLG